MSSSRGAETGLRPDIEKLEEWAAAALMWASEALDANPPIGGDPDEREAALLAIDDVLHIGAASELGPVVEFFRSRTARAVNEMGRDEVRSGVRIWRMYNHGFVVKTRKAVMGFDLIRGYGSTMMQADVVNRLAELVEVATISHRHADHTDLEVCRMISEHGGEILVPPDLHDRWSNDVALRLVKMSPDERHEAGSLVFEALRGHHDGPPDNCDLNVHYVLTEEGLTMMHMGDHWINRRRPLGPEDEALLDDWGRGRSVDVLLLNRSPYQFANLVERIKPRIVISSHENELSHDIAARATYKSSIEQMKVIGRPCLTMAWGESCSIVPPQTRAGPA